MHQALAVLPSAALTPIPLQPLEQDGRDQPDHHVVMVPPRRQRADASVSLSVGRIGGATRVAHLAERGSARLRLPNTPGPALEAVTINTGGGITGGDRFAVEVTVGTGADVVVTSAAAEKIYRAVSDPATVESRIVVEADGRLAWLPQETILFDGALLRRSLGVDLHASASALLFEGIVFGRAARGERVRSGLLEDRWRVRRGGRLVYADTLRFSDDIAAHLDRPAVAAGSRALATCLYVAPDAESRLDDARALLDGAASECGASAWDGLLCVRWLAPAIGALHRDVARFMTGFRGRPLPRVWNL